MSHAKYNKPQFKFTVPTPEEMKQRIAEYEKTTGKPVPSDFYERTVIIERERQHEEYLRQINVQKANLRRLEKEFALVVN